MSKTDIQIYVTMFGEFTIREFTGNPNTHASSNDLYGSEKSRSKRGADPARKARKATSVSVAGAPSMAGSPEEEQPDPNALATAAYVEADLAGRSRRLWLLLAYLIVNRSRGIGADELIDLLWPEATGKNPLSTLQNNVSRARKLLADAGFTDPNSLIKCEKGSYRWNPGGVTILDADLLEECAHRFEAGVSGKQASTALAACDLYRGDFLAHATGESWSVNLSIYYRSLFTRLASRTIRALMQDDRYVDAEGLCRRVIEIDPASEEFSAFLMRSETMSGHPQKALDHYEYLKGIFHDVFGTDVSPELEIERELAMQTLYGRSMGREEIKSFLNKAKDGEEDGAFYCSNSVFREIVRLQTREMGRSGIPAQIIAISFVREQAKSNAGEAPSRRSKTRVLNVKRLESVLTETLRSGDPFTKMGQEQFLIMLPSANEENGHRVVDRVITAFRRTYPNATEAEFQVEVYPLDLVAE